MFVKHRLLNLGNNIIYQNDDYFTFSLDSVLLANFVTINKKIDKIIDLCTGNAPIPMLMSYRTSAKIYGIELQKEVYDLGIKSIMENKLNSQLFLINDDIKNINKYFKEEEFDIITCNPPYFKYSCDKSLNNNEIKTIARHEIRINLEEIITLSRKYLKNNGRLCIVHRPERLVEIIELMKKNKIEPKKLRLVYPKENIECNMILIEGVKNGNAGMKILSPLIVHESDGMYCQEVKRMFGD